MINATPSRVPHAEIEHFKGLATVRLDLFDIRNRPRAIIPILRRMEGLGRRGHKATGHTAPAAIDTIGAGKYSSFTLDSDVSEISTHRSGNARSTTNKEGNVRLKLGLHTGQQDIEMDELRRMWRYADDNGFDFISVWDHFYEAPPIDGNSPAFESIAAMATLAADTKNARIGCHVFCMTYRNPALLANSIMTIDHVSHGRVELGIGAGWHVAEHTAYGFPFDSPGVRSDRLEDGVQALRLLLTEEVSNYSGEFYELTDAKLYPRPVQERLPIVVGGRGERRTLPTAARLADGWNIAYIPLEEFARLNGLLDALCEENGRDPADLERSVNLHMRMGTNAKHAARIERERGSIAGSAAGTPQQAIETIRSYQEAGAARVSVAIRPPVEWDALQAFVEEVMPAFR